MTTKTEIVAFYFTHMVQMWPWFSFMCIFPTLGQQKKASKWCWTYVYINWSTIYGFKLYVDFGKQMTILWVHVQVKITSCALDHNWETWETPSFTITLENSKISNSRNHICWKKNVVSLYIVMDDGWHAACVYWRNGWWKAYSLCVNTPILHKKNWIDNNISNNLIS
jgi:hypothetical protein